MRSREAPVLAPQTTTWRLRDCDDMIAVREEMNDWMGRLAAPVPQARRFDIELAAAELLTNAFDHGHGSWCSARLAADQTSVRFAVTNQVGPDFGGLPPVAAWSMPGPEQRRGRGLAIVRSVATDTRFTVTDDRITIHAEFAFAADNRFAAAAQPAVSGQS